MENTSDFYAVDCCPRTPEAQTVTRGSARISVLTDRLIRIEKQQSGIFCDEKTQTVINRHLDEVRFVVTDNRTNFAVKTDCASFIFDASGKLIRADMKDGMSVTDFKKGNLGGTTRTLDMTGGKVKLDDGILSRSGAAVLDDSGSLIPTKSGVSRREEYFGTNDAGEDIYVFAYGHDYLGALYDYYRLTGFPPLIPRFAFGNWWSRYKAYSQEEYLSLMRRFREEEIPITVATVDMDWHWTDVSRRFGKKAVPDRRALGFAGMLSTVFQASGWTGYSWNTELFPDYKAFLKELHDNNYKVTLNLHPADGVRFYEDAYEDFARFMGINPDTKEPIAFDLTDKKFIEGYFKYLHNGYEDDGVDFWWIDWQQGTSTKTKGLDPLWLLNHLHSLDTARGGKRPLILSRYAGMGSHRYPLGFSGDTTVCWGALDFQPYFTSTASNAGYTWWSHDIGGHHFGVRDDEMYIRWLWFGVFSPVMRLHSTKNEFLGKEPWKFSGDTKRKATECLRLRHRLIPYIYTMNRRTHFGGIPLIEPMYYLNPEDDEAYKVPNEYYFGSELIAAPITEKINKETLMAGVDVFLPDGRYTDIFTGMIYEGKKKIRMYRDTSSIPVLAKEGAIIPLSVNDRTNDISNPEELEILIYRGNGEFTLYEDDGETMNYAKGEYAETKLTAEENEKDLIFTVFPADGDLSVIPQKRIYILSFKDVIMCEKIILTKNGKRIPTARADGEREIRIKVEAEPADKIKVTLKNITPKRNPPKREMLTEFFSKIQGSNDLKSALYGKYIKEGFSGKMLLPENIKGPAEEISAMK